MRTIGGTLSAAVWARTPANLAALAAACATPRADGAGERTLLARVPLGRIAFATIASAAAAARAAANAATVAA